jgi:hypothetical protein
VKTARLLLAIGGTFGALAMVEVGVRVGGLDPGARRLGLDVDPIDVGDDVFWPMPRKHDPDGDGHREAGLPSPPDGAPSVVLLGDSIVFGFDVPAAARVAAHLGARYRVIDAAVPGYSTTQESLVLARLLARELPHAVVVGVYQNDGAMYVRAGDGVREACLRVRPAGVDLPVDAALAFYAHSALLRAVGGRWLTYDHPCQREGERRALRALDDIADLCETRGVRLLVALMAATCRSWDEALDRRPRLGFYREIETRMGQRGVPVVDALPALAREPHADVALDDAGHRERLLRDPLDAGVSGHDLQRVCVQHRAGLLHQ